MTYAAERFARASSTAARTDFATGDFPDPNANQPGSAPSTVASDAIVSEVGLGRSPHSIACACPSDARPERRDSSRVLRSSAISRACRNLSPTETMSTVVDQSTSVVKRSGVHPGRRFSVDWSTSTMLERLKWVLAARKGEKIMYVDKKTKQEVSGNFNAGTWAMAAGMSRSAISNQTERMKLEPHRTLNADTVSKLAPLARVSAAWLLNGSGQPESRASEPVMTLQERYTVTDLVKEAARRDGFDEAFVDGFVAALDADEQPTFGKVWKLLEDAYASHQRKTRRLGDPGVGLDERPPPRSRQTTRKKL